MPCWSSYSYHNNQYIFGQWNTTCLRGSKRTLKPSKTKCPLGKHPSNLMPYKIIPRYGIGAQITYAPIRRGTSILLYPSNSYLRRDSAHPVQGFKSTSNKIALTANIPVYTSSKEIMHKQQNENETLIITRKLRP